MIMWLRIYHTISSSCGGWPNETLHYVIIIWNENHNTISHDHVITHISYNIFIMWWLAKLNTTLCHYHMKWDTQHNKSWSCDYAYIIQYFNHHDHVIGKKKHYDMTMIRTDKHNIMSHDHVTTHIWYNIFIMWLAKWNNNVIMIWSDKSNTMSHIMWLGIYLTMQYLDHVVGQNKHYHIIIDKHNVTKLYFEDMSLGAYTRGIPIKRSYGLLVLQVWEWSL